MAQLWHMAAALAAVPDGGRDQCIDTDPAVRGHPMRIRLLLAAAAALTLAACSDSSTTSRLSPTGPTRDITCRSGYHIATREDGSEGCEPDVDGFFRPAPAAVTPAPAKN
jgi:hypothetical protein